MELRERVQPSDWVTGIGGLILFISVFLDWFKISFGGIGVGGVGGASGVDATKLCYLIVLLALIVIAVVVLRVVEVDLDAIPIPMSVVVMAAGGLSLLIIIVRMVIHQDFLSLSYGIFVSLVAAIAVVVGGVLMQREDMY
jgi:hypothetical protein